MQIPFSYPTYVSEHRKVSGALSCELARTLHRAESRSMEVRGCVSCQHRIHLGTDAHGSMN